METIGVRFAVAFKHDGLNLEDLKTELKKYGEILEVEHMTENNLDVYLVCMDSDLVNFIKFKFDFNCADTKESPVVLYTQWQI